MSSLQYSITRKLMRHAKFYNEQILPFFQVTPRFAVQAYCLRDDKDLFNAITAATNDNSSNNTKFLTLQEIIRKNSSMATTSASTTTTSSCSTTKNSTTTKQITFAMNSLRLLSTWKQRMNATSHATMNLPTNSQKGYKFEVGDIVQHSELNHIGVVAAKLPICFESEEWINENLGSVGDYRLSHPWYLILVARHDPLPFDFVRYGSELTHVKGPKEAIGCHRMLPMFFSGFCRKTGRYIAREAVVTEQVKKTLQARSSRAKLLKKHHRQLLAEKKVLDDNNSNNNADTVMTTSTSTTTMMSTAVASKSNDTVSVSGGASSRRATSSTTKKQQQQQQKQQQNKRVSSVISSSKQQSRRSAAASATKQL